MDAVFSDIFPDAVKIGMVSSSELIHVIADGLTQWKARHIVVDPVMVATSGSSLLKTDAIQTLMDRLLPLAELVDIRQELERIAKEKTKAEENLARIEKKLQNESFVSKAPEAVVNAEREKADKARALIAKLGLRK